MKKALLIVSIFSIFIAVACTSRTSPEQVNQPTIDTSGLAAFQDWQLQNEMKDATQYMNEMPEAEAPVAAVRKKTVKRVAAPQRRQETPAPVQQNETGTVNQTPTPGTTETVGTGTTPTDGQGEVKEEKKGPSNAVKGAVIGAASGAVLGAVINKKNRVAGGVIGGVLGGGIGYGIGRKKDKREER